MKKLIVIFTLVLATAVFAGGAFYYQQAMNDYQPPGKIVPEKREEEGLIRTYSPILGPVNAPVTIVEFLDPSCEACKAFFPIVEEIRKTYPNEIRVVVRYAAFHEGSDIAVGILEAARKQDLFEPVLTALFDGQHEWAIHGAPDLDRAWEIAGAKGLDIVRAKNDAALPEVAELLKQEMADIKMFKVRQTPTFFINGKQIKSISQQKLRRAVTEEVEKAKALQQ